MALKVQLVTATGRTHDLPVKTVEIPDILFRDALAAATERGVSLKDFLAKAVRAQIGGQTGRKRKCWPVPPPKVDKAESRRIEERIAKEFGRIDLETWR